MSKYLDRLSADEKSLKKEQAIIAEAGAKAHVEQKISGLKANAATLQAAYNAALGSTSFSIDKVFGLTREIERNASDLALAESILANEFSN
jgi:hypothetical protein